MRRVFAVVRKIILLIIFVCGEIAFSFSDKVENDDSHSLYNQVPLSFKISNQVSDYQEMNVLDENIQAFMKKWKVIGASVAVVQDEKLIYSKGYGYADIDSAELVDTKHIFRIASVSKLITATAIMKLIDEGKLSLDDKVFGYKGILNNPEFLDYKDARVNRITIRNLLNHTSGWTNKMGDVLFMHHKIAKSMRQELPLDQNDIIKYCLKYKLLDYSPGKKANYLNFGYVVLGQVIEELSGMPYEDYVQSEILHPLGIYDMHLGNTAINKKYHNEVKYYGLNGSVERVKRGNKYLWRHYQGNYIETLGAAGAWLASPTEIMKLLVSIDGNTKKPDILTKELIDEMVDVDKDMKPLGWTGVNKDMRWRTGTLSGTSALLMSQTDGISWFIVINTTPKRGKYFPIQMNKTMIKSLASIETLPEKDLFTFTNALANTSKVKK